MVARCLGKPRKSNRTNPLDAASISTRPEGGIMTYYQYQVGKKIIYGWLGLGPFCKDAAL